MRLRLVVMVLLIAMIGLPACRAGRGITAAPVELTVVTADGEELDGWDAQWDPTPERLGGVMRAGSRMRWSAVAEGDYDVTIMAPGYQDTTITITVVEGRPVEQQVTMHPAG